MHIQFQSIRIKGFRSFINEAVIQFDSAGAGLYFLKGKNKISPGLGSNGSGKSTVIDALMWCLYGKTVQGLKNPDIIPWTGKAKTEVSVSIEVDGEPHVIKRTVNPNRTTIDDKEAGQDYINDLIAIPFDIIPYTIILGQRQPLFFDLTAGEKLKLFSEVLDLDRWESRSVYAQEIVSKLEREIQAVEAGIVSLENEQERNGKNLVNLKDASKTWEADRSLKLASREKDKKLLQAQIAALMPDRDDADLKLEAACVELKAIEPLLEKLSQEERPLADQLVRFKTELNHAKSSKSVLEKKLASFSDKVCPTCDQPLTDPKKVKALKDDINKQIKALDTTKLEKQLGDLEKEQFEVLAKMEVHRKTKSRFRQDEMDARDTLGRIEPRIARLEEQIKALDKASNDSLDTENPYTEQIRTLRERIGKVKALIENADDDIKAKTEQCERTRFWVKGFKDIKLYTIEEVLQEITITTNCMLEEFGLVGWNIAYDVERETKKGTVARGLNITVLSPANKEAVKWESWSGGEAQRLRLIGSMALSSVLLNHVGVSTNLMVLDEPTESLSKEGVNDLVELLAQRAKDTDGNILLIDHHALLSNRFVAEITIIKDKTGSHLEL